MRSKQKPPSFNIPETCLLVAQKHLLLSNHAAVSLVITANPKSQHDTKQMLMHMKQTCCLIVNTL